MQLANTLQGHTTHDDSRIYLSFWLHTVAEAADHEVAFHQQPMGKPGTLSGQFTLCTDTHSREYLAGKKVSYEITSAVTETRKIPVIVSVTATPIVGAKPDGVHDAIAESFEDFIANRIRKLPSEEREETAAVQ